MFVIFVVFLIFVIFVIFVIFIILVILVILVIFVIFFDVVTIIRDECDAPECSEAVQHDCQVAAASHPQKLDHRRESGGQFPCNKRALQSGGVSRSKKKNRLSLETVKSMTTLVTWHIIRAVCQVE